MKEKLLTNLFTKRKVLESGVMLNLFQHLSHEATLDRSRNKFGMTGSECHPYIGLRAVGQQAAFTMAEILLSLTIIGVVAAITLPSLTGNINERTWTTQRKALFARMSQAVALMPALNGYGGNSDADIVKNKAAEVFITSGLSKVLKINNICDKDNVIKCGLPEKFTDVRGIKNDLPSKISNLNDGLPSDSGIVKVPDSFAAALETANGESILLFYNPYCTASNVLAPGADDSGYPGQYIKQQVCVNMIFDLNGKKGPNTIGKDMGIMTVVYSSDSKVVMPMYPKYLEGSKRYDAAREACGNLEQGEYRLPNIEELLALYYNRAFTGNWGATNAWTSAKVDSANAYEIGFRLGMKYIVSVNQPVGVICVQR